MNRKVDDLLKGEEDLEPKCEVLVKINRANGMKNERKKLQILVDIYDEYLGSE